MPKFQFPINPPYRITQKFGERLIFYPPPMEAHNGIDIAVSRGTPVLAPVDSQVAAINNPTDSQVKKGYGRDIRLLTQSEEGENIYYDQVFAHLLKILVTPGQLVKAGEVIGLVDSTGYSTGDHLHYGVRQVEKEGQGANVYQNYLGRQYAVFDYNNGYFGYIDPMPFFEAVPSDEVSPVDIRYGQSRSVLRERTWKILHEAYAKRQIISLKGFGWEMYGEKFKKAFVYGYWDSQAVYDPAMVTVWENMTKPEFLKRIGKL